MSRTKKVIIVLIILAVAGLSAFRAAQVISAKKMNEDPKRQGKGLPPLVDVAPVTPGLIKEKLIGAGDMAPYAPFGIYSKVQGWVEKINFREGDRVSRGQVLATRDARE